MGANEGAGRHAERRKRVMAAVQLKRPGRAPVAFHTMLWYAKYGGTTIREVMYDYDKAAELGRRAILEFDPDMFAPPHQFTTLGRVLAAAALPGFFYMRLVMGMRSFAHPKVVAALEAMRAAGEEANRLVAAQAQFTSEMEGRGYVLAQGAVSIAPFDLIGDYFRGARGILTDMYRRKDKLLAALEKAIPFIVRQTIATCKASSSPFVFIPIHWAADNFMSLAQFKTFWWPSFRKVLLGLIEAQLIPVPLWEADCSSRLETIADIPRGKAVYWFERTDLVKAKQVLGGIACVRGNVPPSLLNMGTPEQVDAYCRDLIEKVGRDGGFILDGAFGIPDEAPLENARAMFQAVRKYSA